MTDYRAEFEAEDECPICGALDKCECEEEKAYNPQGYRIKVLEARLRKSEEGRISRAKLEHEIECLNADKEMIEHRHAAIVAKVREYRQAESDVNWDYAETIWAEIEGMMGCTVTNPPRALGEAEAAHPVLGEVQSRIEYMKLMAELQNNEKIYIGQEWIDKDIETINKFIARHFAQRIARRRSGGDART